GILALRRDDGRPVWQAESPNEILLADDHLLIAAGTRAGRPQLYVFDLADGAPAFASDLPGKPTRVAVASHGVSLAVTDSSLDSTAGARDSSRIRKRSAT